MSPRQEPVNTDGSLVARSIGIDGTPTEPGASERVKKRQSRDVPSPERKRRSPNNAAEIVLYGPVAERPAGPTLGQTLSPTEGGLGDQLQESDVSSSVRLRMGRTALSRSQPVSPFISIKALSPRTLTFSPDPSSIVELKGRRSS